jgi:hypothetical protein
MSTDTLYVGIELAAQAIRVVASSGQRVTISGARAQDPNEWLELALYGLSGAPSSIYAAVATSLGASPAERDAIIRATRTPRFDGVFVCSTPYALARGVDRQDSAVSIVVDRHASSIALVRGSAPLRSEQDVVRPIAGREAREIAIAVRCLVKPHPRDMARRLLRNTVVSGDENEIERIGRAGVVRELEAIGATPVVLVDPFLVAAGAERLALELDHDTWRRLAATPTPRRS